MEQTKNKAALIVKEIIAEVNKGVVIDYEIPTLCNMNTGEEIGFAVVLILNGKFCYTNAILNGWKERFSADDYHISVKQNRLKVKFNVRY